MSPDNPNPEKAAQQALSDCRQEAKNCHLTLAVWDSGKRWAAYTTSEEQVMYLKFNADTPEAAEAAAIRGCEERAATKGVCKIAAVTSERTWYAFAHSENGGGFGRSTLSAEDAKQAAIGFCVKDANGSPCRVTQVHENPGPLPAPSSFTALEARIEREKAQRNAAAEKKAQKKVAMAPAPSGDGNCRPSGNVLRCTSQCFNGNCTVTYENGCKIQVQVQPKFNPFNNQWDYPAPGC